MKENSNKNSSSYVIAKLFLNSLYGRFGLNPSLNKHLIANKKDIEKKLQSSKTFASLEERIDLGDFSMCSFHSNRSNISSNVAIASFVTAYARVIMSQYLNRKDLLVYYTDTDSLFTNKPLSADLVDSKKLGLMKLEAVFSNFVAIGAKSWLVLNCQF